MWSTRLICVVLGAGLGAGTPAAAADRRPVAVIDLSGSPEAQAFMRALGNVLVEHSGLRLINDQSLIGELTGALEDEDASVFWTADAARSRADDELTDYRFAAAAFDADAAQVALHRARPTTRVVELYADLAFLSGRARLGENRDVEAAEAFALVHRLSPGRTVDPVRYPPSVVEAFGAARNPAPETGMLVVRGTGEVSLDGRAAGSLTAPLRLATGLHVIWVMGPDRVTVGTRVKISARREHIVTIGGDLIDLRAKVRRARLALSMAPDPAARSVSMQRIARLVEANDAVLVSMANSRLIAQTWHDPQARESPRLSPGFSAHRLVEPGRVRDVLHPLEVPLRPQLAKPVAIAEPLSAAPPWYKPPPLVSATAIVLTVAIASFLLIRAVDDRSAVDAHAPERAITRP